MQFHAALFVCSGCCIVYLPAPLLKAVAINFGTGYIYGGIYSDVKTRYPIFTKLGCAIAGPRARNYGAQEMQIIRKRTNLISAP